MTSELKHQIDALGFTFIEILAVVWILAVLVAMLVAMLLPLPAILAARSHQAAQLPTVGPNSATRIAKVVALKDYPDRGTVVCRVHVVYANVAETPGSDLGLEEGKTIDVLANVAAMYSQTPKDNSEVIQANLQVGRWYAFTVEKTGYPLPNILKVVPITHEGELEQGKPLRRS